MADQKRPRLLSLGRNNETLVAPELTLDQMEEVPEAGLSL